jgi:chemotaxis protein histidine kinase CheA
MRLDRIIPATRAERRRQAASRSRAGRRRIAVTLTACAAVTVGILGTAGAAPAASVPTAATPVHTLATADFELASQVVPTAAPSEAQEAVASAEKTVAKAEALAAEVEAAEVDLKGAPATVDTSDLEDAAERLDRLNGPYELLAASLIDDTAQARAEVEGRTAALEEVFETAKAEKVEAERAAAEAEAEAAAAAEAERQAAEEAAAAEQAAQQQQPAAPSVPVNVPPVAPGSAQEIARGMLGGYGWGDDQFACLVPLWQKESGWNYQAMNPSSGAYGIPQALPGSKMASAGADWQTNPATQISWGLGYIAGRYGNPCGGWGHSQAVGWY